MKMRQSLLLLAMFGSLIAAGCVHIGGTPGPGPTSTPFPTTCGTQSPNANVFVVMSSSIVATPWPTYGPINGFVGTDSSFVFGFVAAPVLASSSDVVQFVNAETNPIGHSAVGLGNVTAFPTPSFSFPPGASNALGTSISTATWSTGRIAPQSDIGPCFSQSFTLSAGTYYFGDLDFYNTANVRDVIVVSH